MRSAGGLVRALVIGALAAWMVGPPGPGVPAAAGQVAESGHAGGAGGGGAASFSVQIVSPLGRADVAGTVRIVAQISPADAALRDMRFFVDEQLLHVHEGGPPYGAEWVDDNPFERREIVVEAADLHGNLARDSVVLDPLEIALESDVTSVLVEASVQDRAGRVITGLTAADFRLTENGVPQKVELFVRERVPGTFALLIDTSYSLARNMGSLRQAAGRLVEHLGDEARVMVAPFSRDLHPVTGPTADPALVGEAIDNLPVGGGTAIFDALVEIADQLADVDGRRAIVLITDGYDEHSARTFEEAIEAVQSAAVTVYVVGVGGVAGIALRGERMLQELAERTGGRAYFPFRDRDLAYAYDQLVTEVENRYLLSYTPSNQQHDGGWRDIEVSVGGPAWRARARPGYFAPEPPPVRATLEFTVTDLDGGYPELTREDIVVREDGVEQEVDSFQEAIAPVALVLALDAGERLRGHAAEVKAAATALVGALRPQDRVALQIFGDRPVFAHMMTTTREWSLEGIAAYETGGGTALYDALGDSLELLRRVQARRVVILVTGGEDGNEEGTAPASVRHLEEIDALLRETDATVYAVGVGRQVNRGLLQRLADLSGGQAYFPADSTALEGLYGSLLENLRRRYVIGYTSSNVQRDGSWRDVEIAIPRANVVVRSRGGYFAPGEGGVSFAPVVESGSSQPEP